MLCPSREGREGKRRRRRRKKKKKKKKTKKKKKKNDKKKKKKEMKMKMAAHREVEGRVVGGHHGRARPVLSTEPHT
jgi:hypothetical protein